MKFRQSVSRISEAYPTDQVMIIHDLDHTPGRTICDEWPLHLTVISPFYPVEAMALVAIEDIIQDTFGAFGNEPIQVFPYSNKEFGVNYDVPVVTALSLTMAFEPPAGFALLTLHQIIQERLSELASVPPLTDDFGGYRAHIARRHGETIKPFAIDELSICVKRDGERHIVSTIGI
jgi:hypothetical protein